MWDLRSPHTPHLTPSNFSWCLHGVWNMCPPERSQQLSHPLPWPPSLVWPLGLGSLESAGAAVLVGTTASAEFRASQFHCISATPPDSCKTVLPWRPMAATSPPPSATLVFSDLGRVRSQSCVKCYTETTRVTHSLAEVAIEELFPLSYGSYSLKTPTWGTRDSLTVFPVTPNPTQAFSSLSGLLPTMWFGPVHSHTG